MREADVLRRTMVEARNKGQGLLYSSEKALAEHRDRLKALLAACNAARSHMMRVEIEVDAVVAGAPPSD